MFGSHLCSFLGVLLTSKNSWIWWEYGNILGTPLSFIFPPPQFLKCCLILLNVVAEFICWSVDLTEAESQKLKNEWSRLLFGVSWSISQWLVTRVKSSLAQKTLVIPPGLRTLAGMRSAERETWSSHPRLFPNRPLTAHCPSHLLLLYFRSWAASSLDSRTFIFTFYKKLGYLVIIII